MSMIGEKLGLVYTERKHETRKPKILGFFTNSQLMSTALRNYSEIETIGAHLLLFTVTKFYFG